MRITQSYIFNKKVNFGYDKKLNQELKAELANHPDREWAGSLEALNNTCNKIETIISYNGYMNKKLKDYMEMFCSIKNLITGFVAVTFDKLNYPDREYIHYMDEFVKRGSKPDDWRLKACDSIKDWVSPEIVVNPQKVNPPKKEESPLYVPKFDENGVEIVEDAKDEQPSLSQKVDDIKNKVLDALNPKSFLEEFVPSPSSPNGFQDVAGMSDLKRDLQEGILQLINNPEQAKLDFEEYGKVIPKGLLLYGPPGCGKTYITQALSKEIQSPLYLLNISKAGSHYINMTSKNIKAAFDEAISIADKTEKPVLLFMDEIDTLAFDRNSRMEPDDLKQVGTILQAIDQAKSHNVIIIGATNKYNLLDPAVRRRFDSKVFVDVPDNSSIISLLKMNLNPLKKGQKLLASDTDLETVSKLLQGYSNSSICNISKEAALNAMRRDRADISVEDYKFAIEKTGEEKPDRKQYLSETKQEKKRIGFN